MRHEDNLHKSLLRFNSFEKITIECLFGIVPRIVIFILKNDLAERIKIYTLGRTFFIELLY